jgi:hypothetical protein
VSQTDQTADEVFESLTGFDEIAISTVFGHAISTLEDDRSMMARALVFVLNRRDGLTDVDAKAAAMEIRIGDLLTYFAEESLESGKDEPAAEPKSEPSLSSVS